MIKLPVTIETVKGPVTVSVVGDDYQIAGPTGTHSLAMGCTNRDRLAAHVRGFVSNNGGLKVIRIRLTRAQLRHAENAPTTASDGLIDPMVIMRRVRYRATYIEGTPADMAFLATCAMSDGYHEALQHIIDPNVDSPFTFDRNLKVARECADRTGRVIRDQLFAAGCPRSAA
jgi:hypothetical protein